MKIDSSFGSIWYHGAAYHLVDLGCTMQAGHLALADRLKG